MTTVDGVLEAPGGPACPTCAAPVSMGDRFCESCGAELGTGDPAAGPAAPTPTVATPTHCGVCGGPVGPDRLCQECGARAPSERDHVTEEPASWVAGVCDRGLHHSRNEDAM